MAGYNGDFLHVGRNFPDGITGRRFVKYDGSLWQQIGWPETTGNFTGVAKYGSDLYIFNSSHTRRYDGSTFSTVPSLIGALPDGAYRGGVAYGTDLAVYPATPGNEISLWDGSTRTDIGIASGNPYAAVIYGGDLIVAGLLMTSVDGVSVGNIARYNGSWSAMGTFADTAFGVPAINSLAVHNGDLYAGGFFNEVDGNPMLSIARYDGANWNAVDSGMTGTTPIVYTMLSWNGSLVVGGQFDGAGAVGTPNLVRLIGSTWADFGTGTNGIVYAMTKFDSGRIAIGGDFTSVDGVSAPRVAHWSRRES